MSNKKDGDNDSLSQDLIAYNKAKDFCKNLATSIDEYLKNKEDLKKYVMWDKVEKVS